MKSGPPWARGMRPGKSCRSQSRWPAVLEPGQRRESLIGPCNWGAGEFTACRQAGRLAADPRKQSFHLSPKAVGWQNPFFFRKQKLRDRAKASMR